MFGDNDNVRDMIKRLSQPRTIESLDLKIKINAIRPDEFWDELNNAMNQKKAFYLFNEPNGTGSMFVPVHNAIRSYRSYEFIEQTNCIDDNQFKNNLSLAVIIFHNIIVFENKNLNILTFEP